MRAQLLSYGLGLALLAAGTLPTLAQAADPVRRPNVVVILADDFGYGDAGYHGSKYRTPNLDQLAASGLRLEQHYVFPMCSPTRAALLTGRYASRFGCTGATNSRVLPFDTVTLASALKSAGYETAITGKWHLGSKPDWGPNRFGFEHAYGSLAGGVGPYDHRYKTGPFTQTWHRDGQLIEEEGHVTDLITREAVRFVETKRDRPFFLYVAFTAVHIPIDEPQRWLDANRHLSDPAQRLRAACATHMDDSVGQILTALDRTGARANTLVLFLSDNGAHAATRNDDPQYPGKYPSEKVSGSNAPWRGYKTQLYEGGIRTAAIAHWPGHLRPGRVEAPLHITDWMPTLCGLAGYRPTADLKWDGQDVWPLLSGGEPPREPRTLYWLGVGRRSSALRHGDWKLHLTQAGAVELYNLAVDPGEKDNVATRHPDVVIDLKKRLQALSARDDDAVVKEGP
ncbi:MAG: sulfatase-like hydrolase/transferase [Gemmataceae bacterium]|nr:sulfatase-like hydrolase/transferase [Gemmataceae bacterium]